MYLGFREKHIALIISSTIFRDKNNFNKISTIFIETLNLLKKQDFLQAILINFRYPILFYILILRFRHGLIVTILLASKSKWIPKIITKVYLKDERTIKSKLSNIKRNKNLIHSAKIKFYICFCCYLSSFNFKNILVQFNS